MDKKCNREEESAQNFIREEENGHKIKKGEGLLPMVSMGQVIGFTGNMENNKY